METSLQEYLKFTRTTVVYPQDELLKLAYLANGLASEWGEALIPIQEMIEKDELHTDTVSLLESELGDILWYIIRILDEIEGKPSDFLEDVYHKLNPESFNMSELAKALILTEVEQLCRTTSYSHILFKEITINIGDICGAVKKLIRDKIPMVDMKMRILPTLSSLMFDYILLILHYRFNPQSILEYNQNKLASRKKRSQLHGSGDFR